MKNECNIVRDILPLYVEDLASADTIAFVENHLDCCTECQKECKNMKKSLEITAVRQVPKNDISPLKNVKRLLLTQRIQKTVFAVIILAAIFIAAYAALDAPVYFPYTEELLSVSENADGSITVRFSENVTGYRCLETNHDGFLEYSIEAWSSPWDMLTENEERHITNIAPPRHVPFSLFYVQNNGQEDVCLYKSSPMVIGGRVTLPRLALLYYLIIALISLGILVILFWANRKKAAIRIWIARFLPFPVAYLIGHLAVCGFNTISYSIQHDFTSILFLSIVIYLGFLCAYEIIRTAKEIRKYK